jgi:hypothetical protein
VVFRGAPKLPPIVIWHKGRIVVVVDGFVPLLVPTRIPHKAGYDRSYPSPRYARAALEADQDDGGALTSKTTIPGRCVNGGDAIMVVMLGRRGRAIAKHVDVNKVFQLAAIRNDVRQSAAEPVDPSVEPIRQVTVAHIQFLQETAACENCRTVRGATQDAWREGKLAFQL